MSLSDQLASLGDDRKLQVVKALKLNGPMTLRELASTIGEWEGTHSASEYRVRRAVTALLDAEIIEEIGAVPVRVLLVDGAIEEIAERLLAFDFGEE